MSRVFPTEELRTEYGRLFAECDIRAERAAEVDELADALLADWGRYHAVGGRLKIPWFAVAALHHANTDRDFNAHLHNGDPLTDRTEHLPDGRPLDGEPPFTWEDSATDALRLWYFDQWEDWSIAGTLFVLERRDGWGYRLNHPEVLSPYLWNYSTVLVELLHPLQSRQIHHRRHLERNRYRSALRCRGIAAAAGGTRLDRIHRPRRTDNPADDPLHRRGNLPHDRGVATVFEYPARHFRQSGRHSGPENLGGISQTGRAVSASRGRAVSASRSTRWR